VEARRGQSKYDNIRVYFQITIQRVGVNNYSQFDIKNNNLISLIKYIYCLYIFIMYYFIKMKNSFRKEIYQFPHSLWLLARENYQQMFFVV